MLSRSRRSELARSKDPPGHLPRDFYCRMGSCVSGLAVLLLFRVAMRLQSPKN